MSKIADLLPCPFCGGKADFSETNAWWVTCNECNAETEADMSPEGAAEYWNKRTPSPSSHVEGATHLQAINFPYSRTFNAIAAATKIEGGHIAISVRAFHEAWDAYPATTEGSTDAD